MILDEIIEKTMGNQRFSAIIDEMIEKQWEINGFCSNHSKHNGKSMIFSDSR